MSVSHSWEDDRLKQNAPDTLREAGSVRPQFHHANDAPRKGRSSNMVKQEQPKPALKPKHNLAQLRQSFKQRWQAEYAAAKHRGEPPDIDRETDNAPEFPDRALEHG